MSNFVPILCQVSLENNISLIKENYENFKKIYNSLKVYVVCPKSQIKKFRNKLDYNEIKIINEDQILSFRDFKKMFIKLSEKKLSEKIYFKIEMVLSTNS